MLSPEHSPSPPPPGPEPASVPLVPAISQSNQAVAQPNSTTTRSGYTITNSSGVVFTRYAHIDEDDLSPTVSALPTQTSGRRTRFWHKWLGQSFKDAMSTRGSGGENGRNFVFTKFVTQYCDTFHMTLTPEQRCEYETVLGQSIYQYMYNCTRRGVVPDVQSDEEEGGIGMSGPSRVYASDLWAKANADLFKQRMDKWFDDNPRVERNAGQRRSVTHRLFHELPQAEQKHYKTMALQEQKRIKDGQRLEGDAKERQVEYKKKLPRAAQKMITEAENCAGVQMLITLVTDNGPGNKNTLTSLASEGLKSFRKDKTVSKMFESLIQYTNQPKKNLPALTTNPPPARVYPNAKHNNLPWIPNLAGLRASDLQHILRDFWRQMYGGDGRFLWEEIGRDPPQWLAGSLPGDWGDPSNHERSLNLTWLTFLSECQEGRVALPERVFFRRVIAGPNPIDPSESEEIGRRLIRFKGREVWELVFDKPVTKSHARKDIVWPNDCLLYADYINSNAQFGSGSDPLGLPSSRESTAHRTRISGEIYDTIVAEAQDHPSDVKTIVLDMVKGYNEFTSHLPADSEKGGWASGPVPLILPSKLPTESPDPAFISRRLLPIYYYQSIIVAPKEGTLAYYEVWIEKVLAGMLLYHAKSSTLCGGVTGCIWAVLSLVQLLFNFSYASGDVNLPVPLPPGYDLTRLVLSERERVKGWGLQLVEALSKSTKILRGTSHQRLTGSQSANIPAMESSIDLTQDDEEAAINLAGHDPINLAPLHDPSTSHKHQKEKNGPKARRRRQTSGSETEESGNFTDEDSDDSDFEEKDPSEDEPSENEESETEHGEMPASLGFRPSECPWGRFPEPEVEYSLPSRLSQETLFPHLRSAYDELDEALTLWDRSLPDAERISGETLESAQRLSSEPLLVPLVATLLTREISWNAQKGQGELLFPILARLKSAASTAIQLSLAVAELVKSAKALDGTGTELKDLAKFDQRLRMKMVRGRWIYDEMVEYARFAGTKAKEVDWLPGFSKRGVPDCPSVREAILWCMEWVKETDDLEKRMLEFSHASPYKFGNAVKDEWHDDLESCFEQISIPALSTTTNTTPSILVTQDANITPTSKTTAMRHSSPPNSILTAPNSDKAPNADLASEPVLTNQGPSEKTSVPDEGPRPDNVDKSAGTATTNAPASELDASTKNHPADSKHTKKGKTTNRSSSSDLTTNDGVDQPAETVAPSLSKPARPASHHSAAPKRGSSAKSAAGKSDPPAAEKMKTSPEGRHQTRAEIKRKAEEERQGARKLRARK